MNLAMWHNSGQWHVSGEDEFSLPGVWLSLERRLDVQGEATTPWALVDGPISLCVLSRFSHVQLFVTPWTVASRLLCPWDSPEKNTGVDCHSLFQRIFQNQVWSPALKADSLPFELQGRPNMVSAINARHQPYSAPFSLMLNATFCTMGNEYGTSRSVLVQKSWKNKQRIPSSLHLNSSYHFPHCLYLSL